MFSRSSWLHLRIHFSFFLLPIFLFSLSLAPNFDGSRIFWVFFILHFLLYPASNGYNSYFDKDEKSIGGLKNPPPVKKGLYFLALALDVVAILLSYIKINTTFVFMIFVYGMVSKAYSHPAIRLKKYAWTSWVITGLFQGLFTFLMCYIGVNDFGAENLWKREIILPGLLTSAMLWANYPITQVYQHEEDTKRGDITLSARLGILGTFYFAASVFTFAIGGFLFYFKFIFGEAYAWVFLMTVLPVLGYFFYWLLLILKDRKNADYDHTMRLNFISATCLNAYFIYLFLDTSHVLQLFP
ncbi:MAG TPA: UbiA family prenyltransferase [Flavitalea sp.]|nr:UbiA family prenyltransferase [Flavitalea sp.]